jgi:hypothetical protein
MTRPAFQVPSPNRVKSRMDVQRCLAGKMVSTFRFGPAADRKLRLETGRPPAGTALQ